MYSLGATVNLGNYQTQRIDIGFPLSQLPEGWTYLHVRAWVAAWFRYEIERVIRREHERGNCEVSFVLDAEPDDTASIPPAHPALPLPPAYPESPAPQAPGFPCPNAPINLSGRIDQ